jgi:hypothetical protein
MEKKYKKYIKNTKVGKKKKKAGGACRATESSFSCPGYWVLTLLGVAPVSKRK